MRSEEVMYDLILRVAKNDDRIRAAYMNGSRTNPNVLKDKYRDYDIVYIVTDIESFIEDKSWILAFGEPAIIQEPDANDLAIGMELDLKQSYTWLMLFTDDIRVDLRIIIKDYAVDNFLSDTLCIKLLDKDHMLPEIPESNDSLYYIKPPSEPIYHVCCNEFWWCLNNVAKGIAREQMSYAQRMYMQIVHTELEKMIEWYICMQHAYKVTTGMWGKYFKKYLSDELYEQYEKTYAGCDYQELWNAVFTACDLFSMSARAVGEHFQYQYCSKDEAGIRSFLKNVRNSAYLIL